GGGEGGGAGGGDGGGGDGGGEGGGGDGGGLGGGLGGGPGGYRHYLDHLGPTQAERWKDLGTPALTPELIETMVSQLDASLAEVDDAALKSSRDAALVALAKLKQDLPV
ncbi:MAG: hypothetical protein VX228_12955, partial [Pseudomonadota bacterium]|nr:hypothetical protein [Pseudomonadota bacterium]